MTVEDLRARIAELKSMEDRLQACLADVRAAGASAVQDLAVAAKIDVGCRPLGAVGPPNGFTHRNIRLEDARDAVCELKNFTLGELAAQLGCSTARARVELDRVTAQWPDLVRPAGRLGSRQCYAYVAPAGPGAAFIAQQKLGSLGEDIAVARYSGGGGDVKQSLLGSIADKEIKKAVREALQDGWQLVNVGGKHPLALVKGTRKIGFSSSPTNSGHAANAIRRDVLRAA